MDRDSGIDTRGRQKRERSELSLVENYLAQLRNSAGWSAKGPRRVRRSKDSPRQPG